MRRVWSYFRITVSWRTCGNNFHTIYIYICIVSQDRMSGSSTSNTMKAYYWPCVCPWVTNEGWLEIERVETAKNQREKRLVRPPLRFQLGSKIWRIRTNTDFKVPAPREVTLEGLNRFYGPNSHPSLQSSVSTFISQRIASTKSCETSG